MSVIIFEVFIGISEKVASTITPVNPIPPMVAQNWFFISTGSLLFEESFLKLPIPSISKISLMWLPKLPFKWWFLPWTSEAIAPPIVTFLVPGETGMKNPSGMIFFKSELIQNNLPFQIIEGNHKERLKKAIEYIVSLK